MGTSNSYGGPGRGTPLVASWVDDGPGVIPSQSPSLPTAADPPVADNEPTPPSPQIPAAPASRPIIVPGAASRFTAPRANFTKFVKSGGKNRSAFGKSISGYISTSSGGSRTATKRMGSSRRALNKFANFLSDV